jgi:hypothetical protein
LPRHRLDSSRGRIASGKSRSCLDRAAVGEEEGLHLEEVGAAETTSEASLEVPGEIHDELLAITCAGGTALLFLDDAPGRCVFRPSRSAIPAEADHPYRQGDHPH